MSTNGNENADKEDDCPTPTVQFAFCTPKQNRRNSAPIIIKSPVVDFSKKDKHLNFMSLSSNFPESPSPEEPTSPLLFDAKKIRRPKISRISSRNNIPSSNNKSPVKSPSYQRSPNSLKSPKSPNSANYFKFPPPYEKKKKLADKIDEYEVYENYTGFQPPVSPTNVNYVPISPQGRRTSSSRHSSTTVSGPRGSISSTTSNTRSEVSSLISSSIDSTVSSSTKYRRSTSDLTDLAEECLTENTSLSRPCSPRGRTGSIKGKHKETK